MWICLISCLLIPITVEVLLVIITLVSEISSYTDRGESYH
jgi:hypothetical protein